MARPRLGHVLDLWMNRELVEHWGVTSTGQHRLQYAASWLSSPRCRAISLSLPLLTEGQVHRGPVVENYFENLLPNSRDIRLRMQQRFAARTTDAMALVYTPGRDAVHAHRQVAPGSGGGGGARSFPFNRERAALWPYRCRLWAPGGRRLDRPSSWWLRLPQEDGCQALGLAPGMKDQVEAGQESLR